MSVFWMYVSIAGLMLFAFAVYLFSLWYRKIQQDSCEHVWENYRICRECKLKQVQK